MMVFYSQMMILLNKFRKFRKLRLQIIKNIIVLRNKLDKIMVIMLVMMKLVRGFLPTLYSLKVLLFLVICPEICAVIFKKLIILLF